MLAPGTSSEPGTALKNYLPDEGKREENDSPRGCSFMGQGKKILDLKRGSGRPRRENALGRVATQLLSVRLKIEFRSPGTRLEVLNPGTSP